MKESTATMEAAIARLTAHRPGDGYVPSDFTEQLALLLFGSSGLGRWSHVAKALCDPAAAMALHTGIFPSHRWLLGFKSLGNRGPVFLLEGFPPYVDGDEKSRHPEPLYEIEHDICSVAFVLGGLRLRQRMPLTAGEARATEGKA